MENNMKNSLKLLGLALILSFAVAGTANATKNFNGFTANAFGWGATFGNTSVIGAFSDNFFFELPSAVLSQDIGASVISGWGPRTAASNVEFDAFELFNPSGVSIASGPFGSDISRFQALNEPAGLGTYRLNVQGHLTGPAGFGDYAGTLSVSPVPEPETYAMLLVGLGLLGFAARRRSNTSI